MGTENWIGATECAALLRYFGFRAIVVDFSMDQAEIETNKRRKKDIKAEKKRKKRKKMQYDDDDYTTNKKKGIKKSKTKSSNFFIDADSDNSDDDFEAYNIDDMQEEKTKNTIKNNSNFIEIDCDDIEKEIGFKGSINGKEDHATNEHSGIDRCSAIGSRLCTWILKYYSAAKISNTAANKAGPMGMDFSSAPTSSSSKSSHHVFDRNVVNLLDNEDDVQYNTGNQNAPIKSNINSIPVGSSDEALNSINTGRNCSTLPRPLPLYFQHQGHSRTIIGIKN